MYRELLKQKILINTQEGIKLGFFAPKEVKKQMRELFLQHWATELKGRKLIP